MNSLFNLVLLCGLVVTTLVDGASIQRSHNLKEAVETLQNHYHITGPEWVGKAVFTPYLEKAQSFQDTCTCDKLVLVGMLNVYMDLFTDMLKNAKGTEASLRELQSSVEHLRNHRFGKVQEVWKQLREINSIERHAKNSTIQGGALNDFLAVYTKANEVANKDKKAGTSEKV